MQTDSADPRTGLVFRIGILAVVTLLVTHAGLTAYFDRMAKDETYRKVGSLKPEALMAMKADEQQRLSSGSMPIDKAMQMLSAKGRMGIGPELMPSASRDVAPMQGWMQMPGEVPAALMVPEPTPPPPPSAAPSASVLAPKPAPKHP